MSRMTWAIGIVTVATATCTFADKAKAKPEADLSPIKVGAHCEIVTQEDARSQITHMGTVKEVTRETVTLINVTMSQRTEKSTLGMSIPFVSRWFRSVGIGRRHLGDTEVAIPLSDIKRVEAVGEEQFRRRLEFPSDGATKRGRTVNR